MGRLVAVAAGWACLVAAGWVLIDRRWLLDHLGLSHGWLLLLLAFVAASAAARPWCFRVPAMLDGLLLAAWALLWAALLLPVLIQGAAWMAALLIPCGVRAWLSSAGVLATHDRPGPAAAELLACAGALPWDAACGLAWCLRPGE
jgi:hypothetical protein